MFDLRPAVKEALRSALRARPGYVYDQAEYLIDQAEYLFEGRISDENTFRNLMPCTWVVHEREAPRTLERIAENIREKYGTLERLTEACPVRTHSRAWYERLASLHRDFSWERVGPIFLAPVKGSRRQGRNERKSELEATPTASFVIANGVHCALAAMWRLLEGDTFRPVEAILLLPRVDY